VISFFPTSASAGRYFMVDPTLLTPIVETNESAGIEEGCYTLAGNGALTVNLNSSTCTGAIDTNDTAGLSHPEGQVYLQLDAHGRLRVTEGTLSTDDATDLLRLPLQAFTVEDRVGTWHVDNGVAPQDDESLTVASFFANGSYMLGGVHDDDACDEAGAYQDANGNGAEFGTLTDVANGFYGTFTPSVSVDSNGGCGLHNPRKPSRNVTCSHAAWWTTHCSCSRTTRTSVFL
jgi:hypothetical protein